MTKELLGLEATDISSSFDAARYVAERLRLVRRLKNLTLENLASKLGITRKQLQNYESAQCNLTIARLWEISRLLEIETEFFVKGLNSSQKCLSNKDIELISMFKKIKDDKVKELIIGILNEI